MAGEWILIRHAESEANIGRSSDVNCGLSPNGQQQAKKMGSLFVTHNLEGFSLFTSPYRRAVETAKELRAQNPDLPEYELCPWIREWHKTCTIDGTTYENETISEVVDRLQRFYGRFIDHKLIVVSHATPIALLTQMAIGEKLDVSGDFWTRVPNCVPRWIKLI